MYSSGSVCSCPASNAGVSDSDEVARLALELLQPLPMVRDEALDAPRSGGVAAYFVTWPGRDDARPRVTRLESTS